MPATPTLADVKDERSATMTREWNQAALAAAEYIERDWPDAVYAPLTFQRWVEADQQLTEVMTCMNRTVGRTAGSVGPTGLLVLNPRPAEEPEWALPVAQVRCTLQLVPWTGLYPFGGPIEQDWVRHQITVALPACVRRSGAELVIDDVNAAVDASIYPTSSGRSVEPLQSVWLAAELRHTDDATARQIRATCPDPGRILTQLGPAEIRS